MERLGQGHLGRIAPLAKHLRDAGNWIVSILGPNVETALLWFEAIRLVSDEVIVSALDSVPRDLLMVGHLFFRRLRQGDLYVVVAIGPMEEVKRLGPIVRTQGCPFVALPAGH